MAYLEYRLLRHVLIDVTGADDQPPQATHKLHQEMTPEGVAVVKSGFHLDNTFRLKLPDGLTPKTPTRRPGYSDEFYAKLVDESHARAIQQRAKADGLRQHLQFWVDNGTIEIIDDPEDFMQVDFVSDVEVAVADAIVAKAVSK